MATTRRIQRPQSDALVRVAAPDVRARRYAREVEEALEAREPDFEDPLLQDQVRQIQALEQASLSRRTRKEYKKAFEAFERWCKLRRYRALPAAVNTLRLYIHHIAMEKTPRTEGGLKPRSLGVVVAAIAHEHCVNGWISPHQSPKVRLILRGIRREKGMAPRQKSPVDAALLLKLLRTINQDVLTFKPRCGERGRRGGYAKQILGRRLAAMRDCALFCVCFHGAFRREEVTALNLEDAHFERDVLRLFVKKSKKDQEQEGAWVPLHRVGGTACPMGTLRAWLEAARIDFGPLFLSVSQWGELGPRLSGGDVARILKKRAAQLDVPVHELAGHSFRSGLATSAHRAGKPLVNIAKHMRHVKVDTTRGYIRMTEDEGDVNVGLFEKEE